MKIIKSISKNIFLCLAFSFFWYVILTYVGTFIWTNIGRAIFVMDMVGLVIFIVFLIVIGAATTFVYARMLRRYFLSKFLVLTIIVGAIEEELFYHMEFLPRKFYDHILAISNATWELHPVIYFILGLITSAIIVVVWRFIKTRIFNRQIV